MANKGRNM